MMCGGTGEYEDLYGDKALRVICDCDAGRKLAKEIEDQADRDAQDKIDDDNEQAYADGAYYGGE